MGALIPLFQMQSIEAQSQAQQAQIEAQARADEYNATIARQNADIVAGQTKAEVDRADRERRMRIGANIAAGGASGAGQPTDILFDNAMQEELDLLTIKNEGLLRQRDFINSANLGVASAKNARNQVPLIKAGARASKAAAVLTSINEGVKAGMRGF